MNLRIKPKIHYFQERIDYSSAKPVTRQYKHKDSFVTKEQLRKELLQKNNIIVDLEATLETTKEMVSSYFTSVARRNSVTKDEMKRLNNTIKMHR